MRRWGRGGEEEGGQGLKEKDNNKKRDPTIIFLYLTGRQDWKNTRLTKQKLSSLSQGNKGPFRAVGGGTERSLGGLIAVQMRLQSNDDGRAGNTGFHRGLFTGSHQHALSSAGEGGGGGTGAELLPLPGCFPPWGCKRCAFPTAGDRWQQKHAFQVRATAATAARAAVTKWKSCSLAGAHSWVQN